jgi:hypothetical protein
VGIHPFVISKIQQERALKIGNEGPDISMRSLHAIAGEFIAIGESDFHDFHEFRLEHVEIRAIFSCD